MTLGLASSRVEDDKAEVCTNRDWHPARSLFEFLTSDSTPESLNHRGKMPTREQGGR